MQTLKMPNLNKFLTLLILVISITSLTGCNEYWWTRGQPPSATELLKRAQNRVIETKEEFNNKRPEIASTAERLSSDLNNLNSESLPAITMNLEKDLLQMEGKLSYGNRPPFNELNGQLRAMISSGFVNMDIDSARLYFARVLFFLSSEMKVPAPAPLVQ